MPLEVLSIQGLWPIVSRVPRLAALLLAWYFTPQRLASMVYVDVFPRHESARIDLAQVAIFNLHLHIINLSPFELELDRANFEFWCGGVKLEAIVLKKQRIASGRAADLYVSGPITNDQANSIHKLHRNNPKSLSGNIEFNCRVRSFAKELGSLSEVQVNIINGSHRGDA